MLKLIILTFQELNSLHEKVISAQSVFIKLLDLVIEGRMVNRIRSVGGRFEANIPMAWIRNNKD